MEIKEYLLKYQPIAYRTFNNALEKNQLSHAYLLSGHPGMPLKDVAIYLAKTLLCDNPAPLACNSCITCMRIDEGNYPDFIVFDGENKHIKKDDVETIISSFDKTALEQKGIMIYILHLVETMTPSAVNSLLKFLEEPGKNIYAFLTTENESKVLPTIISRTQLIHLKPIERELIIKDAISHGVSEDDAQILSALYNDGKTIKEITNESTYKTAKNALEDQLNALSISSDDAIFTCQKLIIPNLKSVATTRFYLEMLATAFQDILNISVNADITLVCFESILKELNKKLSHIDKSLLEILNAINQLEMNVNIALLLDHVIYEITKEKKQ